MKTNIRKKYYIDLKRVVSNIFILVLILMLSTMLASPIMGSKHLETATMVVSGNDTLWGIATEISKGSDDLKVQNVILKIKEINQMENSDIYNGQALLIPIY